MGLTLWNVRAIGQSFVSEKGLHLWMSSSARDLPPAERIEIVAKKVNVRKLDAYYLIQGTRQTPYVTCIAEFWSRLDDTLERRYGLV
jgi:hypothetical protein